MVKQTERCIGRTKNPNIEKLSMGWIVRKKVYGSFNAMRSNLVDLITDPVYENLCDYLVKNKHPKLQAKPSVAEIKHLIGSTYDLNEDQFACI